MIGLTSYMIVQVLWQIELKMTSQISKKASISVIYMEVP